MRPNEAVASDRTLAGPGVPTSSLQLPPIAGAEAGVSIDKGGATFGPLPQALGGIGLDLSEVLVQTPRHWTSLLVIFAFYYNPSAFSSSDDGMYWKLLCHSNRCHNTMLLT